MTAHPEVFYRHHARLLAGLTLLAVCAGVASIMVSEKETQAEALAVAGTALLGVIGTLLCTPSFVGRGNTHLFFVRAASILFVDVTVVYATTALVLYVGIFHGLRVFVAALSDIGGPIAVFEMLRGLLGCGFAIAMGRHLSHVQHQYRCMQEREVLFIRRRTTARQTGA